MGLNQIAKILETLALRQVGIGEGCMDRANKALGRNLIDRNHTGVDLIPLYDTLTPDEKTMVNEAFTLSIKEVNGLIEEVFRIREELKIRGDEEGQIQLIQALGLCATLVCVMGAILVVGTIFLNLVSVKEVPVGYLFNLLKHTLIYISGNYPTN